MYNFLGKIASFTQEADILEPLHLTSSQLFLPFLSIFLSFWGKWFDQLKLVGLYK